MDTMAHLSGEGSGSPNLIQRYVTSTCVILAKPYMSCQCYHL